MGVVKNRAKSGDHYRVDAFVSLSFEGDKIVGYESVRAAPEKEAVARAQVPPPAKPFPATEAGDWVGGIGSDRYFRHGGLRSAARSARDLVDNPAMQFVYTGRNDEIGNLEFAIRTLRAQLRTVLVRIRESACAVSQESRG